MNKDNTRQSQLQAIDKLLNIMEELREKCPWDKKQTIRSIRHLTIEEVFELSEAILNDDTLAIEEELGDLLLHIIFYAQIGSEKKHFDIESISNKINNKLINRHPHIYGDVKAEDEKTVKRNWEKIKLQQKKQKGDKVHVLDGVPKGLPPLIQALRIQDKAKGVGFDWNNKKEVWNKVKEEFEEFEIEMNKGGLKEQQSEFGDILFSLVNMARHIGINPEEALYQSNTKFKNRFTIMEEKISQSKRNIFDLSQEEMEKYWEIAKNIE